MCVVATQPEYTSTPKWDTQYGVEGKKGKIALQVRGFPLPTIHWYLNDEKLDYQDKYSAFISPSGTVTLEVKKVGPDTMGTYKCYAENESGSAVKYVKYEFAGVYCLHMSRGMGFPTMWYVRPAKTQISLRICAV